MLGGEREKRNFEKESKTPNQKKAGASGSRKQKRDLPLHEGDEVKAMPKRCRKKRNQAAVRTRSGEQGLIMEKTRRK